MIETSVFLIVSIILALLCWLVTFISHENLTRFLSFIYGLLAVSISLAPFTCLDHLLMMKMFGIILFWPSGQN